MGIVNNTNILNDTTVLTFRGGASSFFDTGKSPDFDPASMGFDSSFTNDIVRNKFPEFNAAGYPRWDTRRGVRPRGTPTATMGHSPS